MSVSESRNQSESRSRTTERTNVELDPASEGELALQDIGQQIANTQLSSILKQAGFQDLLTGATEQAFSPEALAEIERRAGNAGTATARELELINEASSSAISQGESDITAFATEGLQLLKEQLAPARGLRPTDTPIVDRGGRIVKEAVRQQGQLVRGVNARAAEAKLNFPLARQRFQEELRNQGFTNRLNLSTLTAQSGLQLANTGNFLGSQKLLLEERIASPKEVGVSKNRGSGRSAGLNTEFDFGSLASGGG